MLRRCLIALSLVFAAPAQAQLPPSGGLVINQTPVQGGTANQCLYVTSTGRVGNQACGGAPSGAAGGDLTGTYPNPTIKASVVLTTPNIGTATGTALTVSGALRSASITVDATNVIRWMSRTTLSASGDGNMLLRNFALDDFNRIQLGGTTNAFPSLKRSGATVQARLADDSDFAPLQGQLRTDTAYAVGVIVPTGSLLLYDSTGTAYRVPAVLGP